MVFSLITGVPLSTSQTGLTLAAQLIDTAGTNVGSSVSTGFYEIGQGLYQWYYASYPDGFRGSVVFKSGSTVVASVPINPQEAEYTDVKASTLPALIWNVLTSGLTTVGSVGKLLVSKLGLIGTGRIDTDGPVTAGGVVKLSIGADYLSAHGNALVWTDTEDVLPDLTGATILFEQGAMSGSTNGVAVVASTNGDGHTVLTAQPTHGKTALLLSGKYNYSVTATYTATGDVVPLVRGPLIVSAIHD